MPHSLPRQAQNGIPKAIIPLSLQTLAQPSPGRNCCFYQYNVKRLALAAAHTDPMVVHLKETESHGEQIQWGRKVRCWEKPLHLGVPVAALWAIRRPQQWRHTSNSPHDPEGKIAVTWRKD